MRNKILNLVRQICREKEINEDDNFFVMGGDSLKAAELINEIYIRFNGRLSFEKIFMKPCLKDIIDSVEYDFDEDTQYSFKGFTIPDAEKIELSVQQEGVWQHHMIYRSTIFNIIGSVQIEGDLDISVMETAVRKTIRKYSAFNVKFTGDSSGRGFMVPVKNRDIKLKSDEPATWEQVVEDINSKLGPDSGEELLLFYLVREKDRYRLVMGMHHIVGDEITFQIVLKDILDKYRSLKKGEEQEKPEDDTYLKFASWQRNQLDHGKYINYWKDKLRDLKTPGLIPYASVKGSSLTEDPVFEEIVLNESRTELVKELGMLSQSSLYTVFLGLFKLFLSKVTGSESVPVGFPVNMRGMPQLQNQPGLLVSRSLSTIYADRDVKFREYLKKIQEEVSQNISHGVLPFEYVAEMIDEFKVDKNLPNRYHFNYIVENREETVADDLKVGHLEFLKVKQMSDFEFIVGAFDGNYRVAFTFRKSFIDQALVNKMARDFEDFLDSLGKEALNMNIKDLTGSEEAEDYGEFEF